MQRPKTGIMPLINATCFRLIDRGADFVFSRVRFGRLWIGRSRSLFPPPIPASMSNDPSSSKMDEDVNPQDMTSKD